MQAGGVGRGALGVGSDRTEQKLNDLRKAAQGVEAMFVKDLLAAMRRGVPKNSSAEQGPGSDIYKDMLDQALADKIGATGAMGISKALYQRLSQQIIKNAAAPIAAQPISERAKDKP
ncbi:MAG: rod-binding protein [Fimbriimonadaceae bacterium]